MLMHVRCTIP